MEENTQAQAENEQKQAEELVQAEANTSDQQPKEAPKASEPAVDELAVMTDKYLRLNAEFDNFRKRTAKERVDLIQTASLEVIRELLDVLDDCDRTEPLLSQKDVELKALKEGVQLVFNKFRKKLEQKGLQAFDSKDKAFDVELHEAITEIPAPKKKLVGKVVDEVQKGYNLNGKLIRHAKVVVGK